VNGQLWQGREEFQHLCTEVGNSKQDNLSLLSHGKWVLIWVQNRAAQLVPGTQTTAGSAIHSVSFHGPIRALTIMAGPNPFLVCTGSNHRPQFYAQPE
jgi:hypothetical protein